MLEVRLLGAFVIKYDGKPVVLSSRMAQSLFAYLILTAGTQHRREKLAGMFWPDVRDDKARAYLRHEIWRIRKTLSTKAKVDYLLGDDINISFNASCDYWLDAVALRDLSEGASVDELKSALSVYQGELLPGFYEEWITQDREHLHSTYDRRMWRLLELLENGKRWHEIQEWAERWIASAPASEAAYRYLIIAYDALGERTKVAATYKRCVQALRELDLEPSEETRALVFQRTTKLNIPIPFTSFIGREKELKSVVGLLSKSRLVTLTGAGGVGKTRLAIEAVVDILEQFPDGVWFLDLAPLNDPALVPNTLANLLKLRESSEVRITETLINHLRVRTALIIFDNCEHMIESCAQLVYLLLTSCQGLSILATSREALRVAGEIPYRVPSLEIPRSDTEFTVDELSTIEAVKLFIERALLASPSFAISIQNAPAIAQICRRLDGIPLAIELAAARVGTLSVQQILERLDDRFNLLTHGLRSSLPRHQTLRAMIEWSYDLLSKKEQLLFRRLAVFAGGWTLDAAEEICIADGIQTNEIPELLSQLVHKSLLVVETTDGTPRYRRLETIREFAREKFLETNEEHRLRDQHLIYFLKKAKEIEPYLMEIEQSEWMDYLDSELDNIRLALEWSTSNQKSEQAMGLFAALGWFWIVHCHFQEADDWCKKVMVLRRTVSKSIQAKALRWAAWLRYVKGDFPGAMALHQESLALYRELGEMTEVSTTLQFMGVLEYALGNLVQARPLFEESLTISRQVNNKAAMPRVLIHLARYSEMDGDFVTTRRYYEEALDLAREMGEGHLTMVILRAKSDFERRQYNISEARVYAKEALEICLRLKNKWTTAETLLDFAEILSAEHRYSETAQLLGYAEALFKETETLSPSCKATIERIAEIPKMQLGEVTYGSETFVGQTLKLQQAIEIALKQP